MRRRGEGGWEGVGGVYLVGSVVFECEERRLT
jgi:hypothetical protein